MCSTATPSGPAAAISYAGSGLTARALQQVTGLAVDNAEAVGALSDAALRAEDLQAELDCTLGQAAGEGRIDAGGRVGKRDAERERAHRCAGYNCGVGNLHDMLPSI